MTMIDFMKGIKKNLKKIIIIFLMLVVLVVVGIIVVLNSKTMKPDQGIISRLYDTSYFAAPVGGIDFSKYGTPPNYDELYIIKKGENYKDILFKQNKVEKQNLERKPKDSTLFVFVKDNKIVSYANMPEDKFIFKTQSNKYSSNYGDFKLSAEGEAFIVED